MDWLIIFLAKYLVVAVVLIAIWVLWRVDKRTAKQMALAFILAGFVAIILGEIAGAFYFHPRPFTVNHVKPLIAHAADNGFPSGHTTWAMTLAAVVYFYARRWGVAAFALTVLVGVGRVLAHVHSTIDILAGIIIGVIAGTIGHRAAVRYAPKLFKSFYTRRRVTKS